MSLTTVSKVLIAVALFVMALDLVEIHRRQHGDRQRIRGLREVIAEREVELEEVRCSLELVADALTERPCSRVRKLRIV